MRRALRSMNCSAASNRCVSTIRTELPGLPHHRPHGWPALELQLLEHVEAVAAVEGHVLGAAGLEVGRDALCVASVEHDRDHRRPDPLALDLAPGAQELEVPVRWVLR